MNLTISYNLDTRSDISLAQFETVAIGVKGSVASCKHANHGLFKVEVLALYKSLVFYIDAELFPGQIVTLDVQTDQARLIWLAKNLTT